MQFSFTLLQHKKKPEENRTYCFDGEISVYAEIIFFIKQEENIYNKRKVIVKV